MHPSTDLGGKGDLQKRYLYMYSTQISSIGTNDPEGSKYKAKKK
jgi:hypothetical protein